MASSTRSLREVLAALTALASEQDGFFSSPQASSIGIDRHRLQRLEGQGILERDARGIYRLAAHPQDERSELWRAVLWPSANRHDLRGTLSHGTALSLYDVSTINPSKIHISIASGIRLRKHVPSQYKVHHLDFARGDVTKINGLPATTLFRTLLDLIVAGEDKQFVNEALERAARKSLLTTVEIAHLKALAAVDRELLRKTMNLSGKN